MGKLSIIRPYPIITVGAVPAIANVSRLATPDPKEAVFPPTGANAINFDLGSIKSVDTVFLGYANAATALNVTYSTDGVGYVGVPGNPALRSDLIAPELVEPIYHALMIAAAPFNARYVTIDAVLPAGVSLGVVAIGKAFTPAWGHEWGSGRPVEDTGTVERLIGGGFGVNEGARAGGYQWTFGDLSDAETRQLYTLARDRGSTRSVIMVEDPDVTVGLHERIHWGLFDRFEAYERSHPGNTRWNLRIKDWA